MRKLIYALYCLTVISVMGSYSYAPRSATPGTSNPNSYYHGGSSYGSASSGGGAHK